MNSAMTYGGTWYFVLYTRGNGFLRAGKGREAAQDFHKILDLRSLFAMDPILTLARLGLARAYALTGDAAQSRKYYQDFFALVKDADPAIPILREAKAEYAKLQ
jgi:outer membrane protein assembly factor BamD (BamD/ComL family)